MTRIQFHSYLSTQPCTVAITDFIESNMSLVAGIALGIGIAEVSDQCVSMNRLVLSDGA